MEVASTPLELDNKLKAVQKEIKDWTRDKIGNIKGQIIICRDYLNWIGKVEEVRRITRLEKWVLVTIKRRYIELSVLEEDIWRQRAKIKWELQGDRNTQYFHSIATTTKRNNVIQAIEQDGILHRSQSRKADAFWNFYIKLMGTESTTWSNINWSQLYNSQQSLLQDLTQPITQEEISQVIREWPANKSPRPDGFTGEFYKEFLDILIHD